MTGQNLVSISQIVLWYEHSFRIDWYRERSLHFRNCCLHGFQGQTQPWTGKHFLHYFAYNISLCHIIV